MDDENQELERAITANIHRKAKLIQDIRRLKTENGMKIETTARHEQKMDALKAESEEREEQYLKAEKAVNDRLEIRKKLKPITQENRGTENADISDEKEKLKDTFKRFLDRRINNLASEYTEAYYAEAYNIHDKSYVNEDQTTYSRSQHISTIMVVLEEIVPKKKKDGKLDTFHSEASPLAKREKTQFTTKKYMTTFRVAQQTTVIALKEKACKFWNKKLEDYDFFDEKGELLEHTVTDKKEPKKLERFFKFRKNDLTLMMVVMKPKQLAKTPDLDESMEQAIDVREDGDPNNMDAYQNYKKMLPKLKPYFEISSSTTQEKENKFKTMNHPNTFGDNHICVVLIILAIFIVSLLSIVAQKDVAAQYVGYSEGQKLFAAQDFSTIFSLEDLFNKLFSNLLVYASANVAITTSSLGYDMYKPIVFRQYRVKSKPCSINLPNFTCYYETYDSQTRETGDLAFIESDFSTSRFPFTVRDEEEEKYDAKIQGAYGEYGSSAYIKTYDPLAMNPVDFLKGICAMLAKLKENKETCKMFLAAYIDQEWKDKLDATKVTYVDQSTRALRITTHFYHEVSKGFILFDPLIEFTPLGTVITTPGKFLMFRPNLKEHTDAHQRLLGIITVVFATFLLIFVISKLFNSGHGRVNLNYFLNFQAVLNLIIIMVAYYSQSIADKLNGYKFSYEALMETDNINVMHAMAHTYELFFIIKSVLIGLTSTRLLLLLKLNTRVETIVKTYEKAIPMSYTILFSIGPFIMALAFFAHFSLGPKEPLYSMYGSALAQILVLIVGLEEALPNNYNAAEIIIVLVAFFFLYLMVASLFAAVNVENFRQTMLDYGKCYHKNEKYIWKRKHYLKWLIAWVPTRMRQSILKRKKMLEDAKEKISKKLTRKSPPKAKYEIADTATTR